jgi:hypothetical protein
MMIGEDDVFAALCRFIDGVMGAELYGVFFTHRTFAPIQTAAPMRPPMPTMKMKRPSFTSPREPRSQPP